MHKNAQKSLEMIKKTQNELQTLDSEGNENQNGKLILNNLYNINNIIYTLLQYLF